MVATVPGSTQLRSRYFTHMDHIRSQAFTRNRPSCTWKVRVQQQCTCAQQSYPQAPGQKVGINISPSRRSALLSLAAAAVAPLVGCGAAQADIVYDAVRSSVRPETDSDTAVVTLLDAKGTLLELKALAATAPDSEERFRARRQLPGMAKRLRELGPSVPTLVALVKGDGDTEAQLSREYGGTAGEGYTGGAVPLYIAIGNVITLSGRTIQKQAQASPQFAADAIARIDDLLAKLPQDLVDKAKDFRKQRAARAAA